MARHATADSRKYNRQRFAKRADAKDIHVGDTVLLKAEERLTLTSCGDPEWGVVRVRSPVLWLRQQQSDKLRLVNGEKVKLVDPQPNWDEITPCPHRTQCRSRAVIGGAPIVRPLQTPHPPPPGNYGLPTTGQPLSVDIDLEGWAVKQPRNSPPHNLPDTVTPLKLSRRNHRWAIDIRASIKRPVPDVPHRWQHGR